MPIKVSYSLNGRKTQGNYHNSKQIVKDALYSTTTLAFKGSVAKTASKVRERELMAIAIFFQRLCSRTPIDEVYKVKVAKGDIRLHVPDDDYTRYNWYLIMGKVGRKITAKEMVDAMGEWIFQDFNNKQSIRLIYIYLDEVLPEGKVLKSFIIGNSSLPNKFNALEFGGFDKGDTKPKKGPLEEHGIKSRHSVQAPVGMFRITKAEFHKIASTPSVNSDVYRLNRQVISKIPTEREFNSLLPYITRSHLPSDDIERFYEKDK